MNSHEIAEWLVNAVIATTLIEGVLLISLRVARGRGPATADVVFNLAAGLCLLGALRSEIASAGELACAAWLAGAGVSHALDVRRRWPRPLAKAKRRIRTASASTIFHPGTKGQT